MPISKKNCFWIKQSTKNKSFESQYIIDKEIGRGATSSVFQCKRKGLPEIWSVKVLKKNTEKKVAVADAAVITGLKHKNIVNLREIFESYSEIHIVQEFVNGGELFDRIGAVEVYSESVASRAIRDIIYGLAYLHGNGIAHKNIKPENIVYANQHDDSPVKLSDFTLSSIVNHEVEMTSVCGSPAYSSPELLKGLRNYGLEGDMWTVGVILYILLSGNHPFDFGNGPVEVYKQIIKGDYEFFDIVWYEIGDNAKDLLSKMLTFDPKLRLTASEASTNCWVNSYAAKKTNLKDVKEKIKLLSLARKNLLEQQAHFSVFTINPHINRRLLLYQNDVNIATHCPVVVPVEECIVEEKLLDPEKQESIIPTNKSSIISDQPDSLQEQFGAY